MRCATTFWAIATYCLLSAGCTVCQNAKRTVCDEPRAYSWKHDRRRSIEAYRQLADEVWLETTGTCPELSGAADYGAGFRDGFVDFVYAGGTGEPPPVPPRHFWNVMLRSPEGKAHADQWFAGYRHGARVARDGGYREFGTVDSSLVAMYPAMPGLPPMRSQSYSAPIEKQRGGEETLPEPFSPPPLSGPPAPPDELPRDINAGHNDDAQVPVQPMNEADAFQDDPVEDDTAPADGPQLNESPAIETEYSMDLSTAGESVEPAIATAGENAATDVILVSAKQPEIDEVLQAVEQTAEPSAHSTVRFVPRVTSHNDSRTTRCSAGSRKLPKLTLSHFRGTQSGDLKSTASGDLASSPREWMSKGTTIRIRQDGESMPAASASGFIPFGVTFDR